MKFSRAHLTFLGGLAFVVAGTLITTPAQAQLADLTKAATKAASDAAGKIADTLTGTTTATSATVPAVPNASTEKSARVMLLDKQTNRRHSLVMIAGEAQAVGNLSVKLTKCLPDYGAVLGQDVAWLDITESGGERSAPWFSGWMFNTYPEISTLDHPRYDVQLQGCGVKARQVIRASGSAPVVESEPVVDTEAAADTPAGQDPFYVPGVEKGVSATEPAPVAPAAPAAEQVIDTEAPAAEAQAQPEAAPAAEAPAAPAEPATQEDLHKMMDSGTY